MKIPAILTLLLAAVLSALPMSQARADDDVSFDVFYNSLGDQGDWYNTPEYGYVWQPSIAYQNDKWRPYSDGYWAQTDDGWTWVSYENFGWATYHYGRWTQLEDTGWVWVPGYQWGPGWVSWRTNDDYVGWAPLPPKHHSGGGGQGSSNITVDYNDVESDEGYSENVDSDYDIGPGHYCFVPVHSFSAPVLSQVILPPAQNIIIIENTTNVTNITYQKGGGKVVVINNGPNFQYLSHHVDHPWQHLILEHHTDLNYLHEHMKNGSNPTLVKNGTLFVPTPYIEHRPVNFNQTRPLKIRETLPQAKVDHGWRNTGADQQTIQRVRDQVQQQARDRRAHPPGNPAATMTPPVDPRQRERDARPTPPGASPAAITDPRQREREARPTPPGESPAPTTPDPRRRGRDGRTNVAPTPAASPAATTPLPRGNSDADKRARRDAAQREREARTNGGQPTPATAPDAAPTARPSTPPRGTPPERTNNPEGTHEPTAAPTPARETNPDRDPRGHRPVSTPAATPRNDAPRNERRTEPSAEPRATAPARTNEDAERTPRQRERTEPAANPTRSTTNETAPERHPVRTQEREERTQTPPPAPRQEVREPRPAAQTPPPAPRQEVRESQPRPQAPPRQETQPQPQPTGSPTDDKKRHAN